MGFDFYVLFFVPCQGFLFFFVLLLYLVSLFVVLFIVLLFVLCQGGVFCFARACTVYYHASMFITPHHWFLHISSQPTHNRTQTQELQRLASSTLQHLTHTCMHKTRTPLVRAVSIRTADIKQYNPRFEEGYVAARDYDPDRCDVVVFLWCCY